MSIPSPHSAFTVYCIIIAFLFSDVNIFDICWMTLLNQFQYANFQLPIYYDYLGIKKLGIPNLIVSFVLNENSINRS